MLLQQLTALTLFFSTSNTTTTTTTTTDTNDHNEITKRRKLMLDSWAQCRWPSEKIDSSTVATASPTEGDRSGPRYDNDEEGGNHDGGSGNDDDPGGEDANNAETGSFSSGAERVGLEHGSSSSASSSDDEEFLLRMS